MKGIISRFGERVILGAWLDARTGASLDVYNPATLQKLASVPDCGVEDVREAIRAARAAQRDWARVPALDRARQVMELGARVRAYGDELATIITEEGGAPLLQAMDCIAEAAAGFDGQALRADLPTNESGESSRGASPEIVAACLSHRWPLLQMARVFARNLIAGRALICKLPTENPLACLRFAQFCDALPNGLFNLLTGGDQSAAELREYPGVCNVNRGELEPEFARVWPHIVLGGADMDLAVPGVARARLQYCGQIAEAAGPLLVEQSIAAEFAERLHEFVGFLEVGDPIKRDTDLGPLISHEAAIEVEQQVAHAAKAGARLKLGGRCFRPWGLPGHFFQPTILTEVRPGNPAFRNRILGPVLAVTPVGDAREAFKIAAEFHASSVTLYGDTPVDPPPGMTIRRVTQRESR